MKSALYYGREDVRVEEIEDDTLGEGDVRIATEACGICGTDLHEYVDGPIYAPTEPHPLTGASIPIRLGHEFGGRVIETGDSVTGLGIGDVVAVNPMLACNDCRYCEQGLGNLCERGAGIGLTGTVGGFSERVVVPEGNAHELPDGVPDEYVALIEPLAVGFHAVRRSEVKSGETAAVFGGGPIGLCTVLCLQASGVEALLVEPVEARRELGTEIGADATFDPTDVDVVERINERTGTGVDVSFDVAGVESAFTDAIGATKRDGHINIIALAEEEYSIDTNSIVVAEQTITGTWTYSVAPQSHRSRDFEIVIDMLSGDLLDPRPLITSRIELDSINKGFDMLIESDDEVKILVRP